MKYAKEVAAVLVAAAGALITVLGTNGASLGSVDAKHWLIAALAVLGSGALTALVDNSPEAPIIKTVISFLTAGIGSLVLALNDNHITQAEWLTAFVAAATAAGVVYQVRGGSSEPGA